MGIPNHTSQFIGGQLTFVQVVYEVTQDIQTTNSIAMLPMAEVPENCLASMKTAMRANGQLRRIRAEFRANLEKP